MANWDRQFSNGSYYTHWYGRLVYVLDYQTGNQSHISLYTQAYADNGAYSQSGSWDGRIYVNNIQYARSTPSTTISTTATTLTSWGGLVTHDGNGNLSLSIGDYINAPVNEMTQSATTWNLPRIAIAPTISSVVASAVTSTSATITTGISSNGNGSSTTVTTYYRLQGAGSYTSAGTSDPVTITGLIPGSTYQFYAHAANSNGDAVDSGVSTFATLPVAGALPILMGLLT